MKIKYLLFSFLIFCFSTKILSHPSSILVHQEKLQSDSLTYWQIANVKNKDLAKMLGVKLKLKHHIFLDIIKHRFKKSFSTQPSLATKKIGKNDLLQKMKKAKLEEPGWSLIAGLCSSIFSLLTAFSPVLFIPTLILFIVSIVLFYLGVMKGSNIGCLGVFLAAGILILGFRFFLLGVIGT